MDRVEQIGETIAGLVELIVDYPDKVNVSLVTDGRGFVLEFRADKRDIGKVIGKMGRTARALRVLTQAISWRRRSPLPWILWLMLGD